MEKSGVTVTSAEIRALQNKLQGERADIREEIEQLTRQRNAISFMLEQLDADLTVTLRREAEEALQRQLEPNFDDPLFIELANTLQELPVYNSLRDFQKEGLVKMIDRYVKEQLRGESTTVGFINADDAGLGKTLTTAAFLMMLEGATNAA